MKGLKKRNLDKMSENKKEESINLNSEELESVVAGLFDPNKLSYEEELRYMTLKNRFFDLLKAQAQGKCAVEEVDAAHKEVVEYSEELNKKYPREPKNAAVE